MICCWRHRVREAHRWHHARTGHDGRVHAQAVRTARDAGLVPGAFATLDFPLTDVQVFHADRGGGFDDTEIDEPLDVFDVKGSPPRRQRRGRIDGQAAEEGARVPEQLRHDRAAEARPRRLRVVVRQPAAPLHPRIPESEGVHRTGTRPLRNRPTHRCQSICRSARRSCFWSATRPFHLRGTP